MSIRAMRTSSSATSTYADVVAHLPKSPQWKHMLAVVTYDENGGFWDHVAPPKGDRGAPARAFRRSSSPRLRSAITSITRV